MQEERFLPLCPDVVVELRSPSDRWPDVEGQIREYMDNGAQLGWLIDPIDGRLHVVRPGERTVILINPASVSGHPVLQGFVLDLAEVWVPRF